jgi:TPR repeat protein
MLIGIVMISNLAFGFDESQLQTKLSEARNGSCDSQIQVAEYYYNQKDYQTALQWLNMVIDNTAPNTQSEKGQACHYLGHLYYYGYEVSQSLDDAEKWWLQGVEYKNERSAYDLTCIYEGSIKKNAQKAFEYRIKDADMGGYDSALVVAKLYEFGNNSEKYPAITIDYAKAIEYYEKYSESLQLSSRTRKTDNEGNYYYVCKSNFLINYKLATAYFSGQDGVTKNYDKACLYLNKSINSYLYPKYQINVGTRQLTDEELGDAMWKLSVCYRFGRGVTQNPI